MQPLKLETLKRVEDIMREQVEKLFLDQRAVIAPRVMMRKTQLFFGDDGAQEIDTIFPEEPSFENPMTRIDSN